MGIARVVEKVCIADEAGDAWKVAPTVTVRQDGHRMQFAARKAVGIARVVEKVFCIADEAEDARKAACNVADEAQRYADTMQLAAKKAAALAQAARVAYKKAQEVAQGTPDSAETAFFKKQKEEIRKAANMDDEDHKKKKGQVHSEEDEIEGYVPDVTENKIDDHSQVALVSHETWREMFQLAGRTGAYADRMSRIAAEALKLVEDIKAKCEEARSVAQKTTDIVETNRSKKQKREEEEEDGKKQIATSQEEDRKRKNEEASKRQRVAPLGRRTSSIPRNEQQQQQQQQQHLRPHPPNYPPPPQLVTQSVERSPRSWTCKK